MCPIVASDSLHQIARSFRMLGRLRWCVVMAGLAAGLLTFSQCAAAADDATAGIEYFEKHVRPLLVQHCYECHAGDERQGGLRLDYRDGLILGGDSGPAIEPGKPETSRIVEAVSYTNTDLQMPPKTRLGTEQVEVLRRWVAMGAPDPRSEPVVSNPSSTAPAASGMSIEDGREFWSFKPVTNPTVPTVKQRDWVQTPIDAFILAQLEKEGLEPAARADKRTLLRRITFDLIGLPPTPTEMADFLADNSPDAYERVVKRLLDSPEYGVRWGRHWLDVARYADSNGLDENLALGTAWKYRDYVIDAFNRDKPFDRFVIEQLAGDLLPDASRETKTATGFLVLGAKVLAEPDRDKLFMDTIDEQLDTIGKAFMGMTLGCVRCHDHKFDPLKQTDYYALAAIFKSTKTFGDTNFGAIKHWHEHVFASGEELQQIKKIDAEIAEKQKVATTYKNEAYAKIRAAARAQVADYLAAAAQFKFGASLAEMEPVAQQYGLHPRILYQCRRHLEFNREDPLFAPWHQFVKEGKADAIKDHYRALFASAEQALAEAKQKDPASKQPADAALAAALAALNDPSGLLAVPQKPAFAFDAETLAEFNRLSDLARIAESFAPDADTAMGVTEQTVLTSLPIHIRGSHRNLGAEVPRGFPAVMRSVDEPPMILPRHQSGRLEFAQWLASPRHPLTARVYVNRVWGWHFGKPLVPSTENFGALGDRPSHPELLDWLARMFMENGWSTKSLHRMIVTSSVYQMDSLHSQEIVYQERDPENRWLWKSHLRRMDAEQIRDSLLAVSGQLSYQRGGKTVPLRNRQFVFDHTSIDHTKYESVRRAVYLPVIRNNLYTLFEQFDFPDPTMPTGFRNVTTVAPQALFFMNASLVKGAAQRLASQLIADHTNPDQRVQAAYELTLGRPAEVSEIDLALQLVADMALKQGHAVDTNQVNQAGVADATGDAAAQAEQSAWAAFCQSLLSSNEFIYVR